MAHSEFKVYRQRWLVLLAFMIVVAVNQLMWITFAPITSSAAAYYHVSDLSIGLLSLVFMAVYIVVSIPASWMIDSYGIRTAVGIGAALTGLFGLMRGLAADSYTLVLIAQIGIAVGQPFILNAITSVSARWFPMEERATAAGLGSLAMYVGIAAALTLTPNLTLQRQISGMLTLYGIVSLAAAALFFIFVKERPPTPPCRADQEARSLVFDGLKESLRMRDFALLLFVFFVGLGVFNAVTTWIEDIVRPRGFSIVEAGNIGGMMIVGGILGAVIIPLASDYYRRRTPFLLAAVVGATAGLIGVTFADSYGSLLTSAFIFGFFLLSAGPLGFQYGAEITYPTPEGTSNGLMLLMGQISGIAFILGMDSFKSADTGSMTNPLMALIGLMFLALLVTTRLRDAPSLTAAAEPA